MKEKQRRDFAPCTLKDVQIAIDEIQVRLGSQRRLRSMKRITKFIEAMTQLGQVVEVFLNVESVVAFVWAASTWVETLDLLLDSYVEIGEILPGLAQFRDFLGRHPYLKVHLENYYCDVLDFHRNALDVFSRPAWKTVFHSSWRTFKTRFGPILNSLKRHRELISDEKLTIAISEVRNFRSEVQDSHKSLEEKLETLSKQMKQLQLEEKEEETQKLQEQRSRRLQFVLNKFDVADCRRDLEHIRRERRHHSSSGDWILDHPLFKEWTDLKISRNSTLYLNGSPGSGKTILTSRVVDHLEQLKSYNSAQGREFRVVYFYFNHMQPDKRTLTGLLLALLSQLIHQDDVLLEQTYQQCLAVDQQKLRSSDTIRDLASVIFKSQRLCFVILDGLDECVGDASANPAKEQRQVIDWFEVLTIDPDSKESHTCKSCVRLFISGQRNGVLEQRLGSYPSIRLETAAAHTKDIELYATRRSAEIREKFRISSEAERDLVSMYGFKQELKAENFPQGLHEAWVPKLPKNLHSCFTDYIRYERVAVRVFENPIEPERLAAKTILGLVICAERSLMWKEIQSRFCIDVNTETADADHQLLHSCKQLCGSLVEVERSQTAESKYDDVVELVHHTARVYLIQSGRLCISRENINMALFCARYLTSLPFTLGLGGSEISKHAITGYYGFQDYAAAFWWKHAHRAINTATDIDMDLYNKMLCAVARAMEAYGNPNNSFLEQGQCPTDVVRHRLQELAGDAHEWENNFKIEFRTQAIRNTIEALLAEEGASEAHCSILTLYSSVRYKCHKPWCQSFYRGFKRPEDRDQHLLEHDRPFRCCVEGCHGNQIGFLSKADLNRHTERLHSTQPSIHFASPRALKSEPRIIRSAAAAGDLAKVKACFQAGVPIDTATKKKGGVTPLYLAAKNGHIHICQYLLERGADVNFQDDRGHTALHAAALLDDVELTHLLLSQPEANPHLKDRENFTAAGTAAKNGCNNTLSVFISRGLASQSRQDDAGRTCLSIAMNSGNLNTIKLLINNASSDLNHYYSEMGDSTLPLHAATKSGWVEIVKLLLSSGRVDVNKVDLSGRRALHHACENGRDSIVELFLPIIDDHNAKDYSRTTPFQYAFKKRHWSVVKLLLEKGANIELNDEDSETPLSLAAENGYDAIVKLLLENGANIESKDRYGQTPLSLAAENGYDAIVKLLLETEPISNQKTTVENGYDAIVKLLLENGANIESKDKYSQTPLLLAAENGHDAIVKLLLENGANIESKDRYGQTPLLLATENNYDVIVKLLLENGANIELNDENSEMPLLLATKNGYDAIVKLLLENGANIESKDRYGQTPLSLAAENNYDAIVKLLLENGANIESKDRYGQTPLSLAAENGYDAIVKLLLENGANIESKDRDGWTPLSFTALNGHNTVAKLLLKKGANTESKDRYGQTPLALAAESRHDAIVKLLEKEANIESSNGHGRTLLNHATANSRMLGIVGLLLQNGTNAESKDNNSRTPLS
ncbi:hypothetical protein RRF57_007602 [Xylaria bambusicola]|uniref:NACHT domain-containing protein n=1 Tax=Xylaria bambusicola TaxID=326684 RepID=A0AAN7ULE1_9PEZI